MTKSRKYRGKRILAQDVREISLVDVPASHGETDGANILLYKASSGNGKGDSMPQAKEDELKLDDLSDDVKEHIQSLSDQIAALTTEKEQVASELETIKNSQEETETESEEEENKEEALLKTLDPEAKALFEDMQKKIDTSAKSAAQAIDLAKKLEEDKKEVLYKSKAQGMPNVLGGDKADSYLEIVKDVEPEVADKITKLLEDAEAALKEGNLTQEIGVTTVNDDTSVATELDKAAKELTTKDSNLTYEEALLKAIEANPKWYDEYHENK